MDLAPDTNQVYEPLTKSIDDGESLMLIQLTNDFPSVAEWKDEAIFRLPQASRQRRMDIIRIVERKFLTVEGDRFVSTPLVKVLSAPLVSADLKRDLLFGQYLRTTPLVWLAIQQVILPLLERGSRSPAEEVRLDPMALDSFIQTVLRPTTAESYSKTRQHITAHLIKFGLLSGRAIEGKQIVKEFFAHYYQPEPRAFLFSLAVELETQGWTGRSEAFLSEQSWTRTAYCVTPAYARFALSEAERRNWTQSSFFGAEKQISLRGPNPVSRIAEEICYGG